MKYAALFALLIAGCPSSKNETTVEKAPEKRASGEQIYLNKCRSCHGTVGTGTDKAPGVIGDRPAPSIEELSKRLKNGGERMPTFKEISHDDVEAVAMYLRTVGGDGPWHDRHEHPHDHGCPLIVDP